MSKSFDNGSAERVRVVGARVALNEYLKYCAYICQPNRSFGRPSERMAFYTGNKVDRRVPKIIGEIEAIAAGEIETRTDISESERTRLRTLLATMDAARKAAWYKEPQKIVFLTPPDSPETLVLAVDIENDLVPATQRQGKVPFARKQRYVSLPSLEKAQYTSELENF